MTLSYQIVRPGSYIPRYLSNVPAGNNIASEIRSLNPDFELAANWTTIPMSDDGSVRDVRGGDGFAIARDILDSGRALGRMQAIITAQGARPFDHNHPPLGALTLEVCAQTDGVVIGIDNLQIARIARMAGAPKVQSAGVDLLHKLHDELKYDSLDALTTGIARDCDEARAFFASMHAETHRQTTRDRI